MSKPLCITMRLGGAISLAGEQSATRVSPPTNGLSLVAVAVIGTQSLNSLPPVGNQEPRPFGGSRR